MSKFTEGNEVVVSAPKLKTNGVRGVIVEIFLNDVEAVMATVRLETGKTIQIRTEKLELCEDASLLSTDEHLVINPYEDEAEILVETSEGYFNITIPSDSFVDVKEYLNDGEKVISIEFIEEREWWVVVNDSNKQPFKFWFDGFTYPIRVELAAHINSMGYHIL